MSMNSPTDAESFYDFLGQSLNHGDRQTPPEALLRKWRKERERAEVIEAIREGIVSMEAGLGRPADDFFAEFRRDHGIADL